MDLGFLKWIEHAGYTLEIGGRRVYIDPFRVRNRMPPADIVFITHTHFDHLSEEALGRVAGSNTQFVAPKETASKMAGKKVIAVEPGNEYSVEGIGFSTVPAYNISKQFHPRANGWVGYVIDADGTKVYHAGDTDAIEEMRGVKVDVALLPMGGTYVMDVGEAVRATVLVQAKAYVPMHYKALLGLKNSKKAEAEFKKRVARAFILEQVQEPYYSFQ